MIVRFLQDNWLALGKKTRAFISGLAVSTAIVLGTALLQLNSSEAIDVAEWARTLAVAELAAFGSYLLTHLGQ